MGKIYDIQDINDNIVSVREKLHKNIHKKKHFINVNTEKQCNIFINNIKRKKDFGNHHFRKNSLSSGTISLSTIEDKNNTTSNSSSKYTGHTISSSSGTEISDSTSGSTVYDESTLSTESCTRNDNHNDHKNNNNKNQVKGYGGKKENSKNVNNSNTNNNNYINGIKKGLMKFYMDREINGKIPNEKLREPIKIKLDNSDNSDNDSSEYTESTEDKNNVNDVDIDLLSAKRKRIMVPIGSNNKHKSHAHHQHVQRKVPVQVTNHAAIRPYRNQNNNHNHSHNHNQNQNNNQNQNQNHDHYHNQNNGHDQNHKSIAQSEYTSNDDNSGNNVEKELCVNKKNEHCRQQTAHCNKYVDPKLSSALTIDTCCSNISSSISKHGKYIYMVYNKKCTDASGNVIVGEIYENKCGKLKAKRELYLSDDFVNVNSGYASSLFDRFTIIEDNGIDTARLKLMDSCFNTIATRNYHYSTNNGSVIGGNFIFGDKYIAVTYISDPLSISGRQTSKLSILFSETLEEICEYTFEGSTCHIAESVELDGDKCHDHGDMYLLLTSSDDTYEDDCPLAKSFSVFKVLKFDGKHVSLVDQVILPQMGNFDHTKKDGVLYISIGTTRADIRKVENPFNKKIQSLIPEDGNELRIYKYCPKSKKIVLLFAKNTDSCVYTKFHPHCHDILIHQHNFQMNNDSYEKCREECPQYPGTFSINNVHLRCKDDTCVDGSSIPYIVSPLQFDALFSCNGKWLLITGSDTSSTQYGIKNVQLFSIKKE